MIDTSQDLEKLLSILKLLESTLPPFHSLQTPELASLFRSLDVEERAVTISLIHLVRKKLGSLFDLFSEIELLERSSRTGCLILPSSGEPTASQPTTQSMTPCCSIIPFNRSRSSPS